MKLIHTGLPLSAARSTVPPPSCGSASFGAGCPTWNACPSADDAAEASVDGDGPGEPGPATPPEPAALAAGLGLLPLGPSEPSDAGARGGLSATVATGVGEGTEFGRERDDRGEDERGDQETGQDAQDRCNSGCHGGQRTSATSGRSHAIRYQAVTGQPRPRR